MASPIPNAKFYAFPLFIIVPFKKIGLHLYYYLILPQPYRKMDYPVEGEHSPLVPNAILLAMQRHLDVSFRSFADSAKLHTRCPS